MPGLRDLKRRIRSVQSTRKITRAMEMVSAAKMRKAQNAVFSSRTYSALAWELILGLTDKITSNHPLLKTYPKAKKVGVVLLGSNRTLVGGLNASLGKELLKLHTPEVISEVVVYGKQAKKVALRLGEHPIADFEKQERIITTEDIYPLAKYITDAYVSGEYKSIVIVYNHFVSTLTQRPTVKRLLPFRAGTSPKQIIEAEDNEVFEDQVDEWAMELKTELDAAAKFEASNQHIDSDYIFEPTPEEVLNHLIPRIIESQLYQTILESDASEHSARMVMMKNATESAGDLIQHLTLSYNQLRQNKITTELAEITAGKIALE